MPSNPSNPLLPPLLTLPLELRQQIYSSLLPTRRTSHPLPSVGLTSVSHAPPKSALLNIHPQLTDEILEYYYTITTWTLIFSHAFNFFRVDPELRGLEKSPALRRLRRVECIVYCDVLLLKNQNYHNRPTGTNVRSHAQLQSPSHKPPEQDLPFASFSHAIRTRLSRAVNVLSHGAENLHTIIVSWIDTTNTVDWEAKAQILTPLQRLSPRVSFQIGQVRGVETRVEREEFVAAAKGVLGIGEEGGRNRIGFMDGSEDEGRVPFLPAVVQVERNGSFVREVERGDADAGVIGWAPIVL